MSASSDLRADADRLQLLVGRISGIEADIEALKRAEAPLVKEAGEVAKRIEVELALLVSSRPAVRGIITLT
jgi:hypothetical protein